VRRAAGSGLGGDNALGTMFPKRSARFVTLLGRKAFGEQATQTLSVASKTPERAQGSKVELQSELDNSRIVACEDDAAEIAAIEHLSRRGIYTATRGEESIQVADRIGKVRMIEQVKEVGAKFEVLRFSDGKEFCHRKVHVHLPGSTQTVPAGVANIRTSRAGRSSSARTWNGLARLYDGPSKDGRIKEIACRHALGGTSASHAGYEARTSQWVRSLVQSIE